MKNLLWRRNRTHPDGETLSELVDARLPDAEATALRAHIAGCDTCDTRFAELVSLRDVLRAMPQAQSPRSFRVRQADVDARPRETSTGGAGSPVFVRMMPALSGVAAAVFVLLVVVDATGGGSDRSDSDATALSAEKYEAPAAARMESDDGAAVGDTAGGASEPAAAEDAMTQLASPAPADRGLSQASSPAAGEIAAAAPPPAPGNAGADAANETAPTPSTPNDIEAASRDAASEEDGGAGGLRIAQVTLAVVALVAAAIAIGWRIRGRVSP